MLDAQDKASFNPRPALRPGATVQLQGYDTRKEIVTGARTVFRITSNIRNIKFEKNFSIFVKQVRMREHTAYLP